MFRGTFDRASIGTCRRTNVVVAVFCAISALLPGWPGGNDHVDTIVPLPVRGRVGGFFGLRLELLDEAGLTLVSGRERGLSGNLYAALAAAWLDI